MSGRGMWISVPRISGYRGSIEKVWPSGATRENFGVFCVKNQDFMQKIIFFPILGGGVPGAHPFHLITDKGNNSYEIIKLE